VSPRDFPAPGLYAVPQAAANMSSRQTEALPRVSARVAATDFCRVPFSRVLAARRVRRALTGAFFVILNR